MKTDMSQALIDSYAEEVVTVASCWIIKRTDETIYYFTDHQEDLIIDSNVYSAATGFLRTAIDQKEQMSVNNMDVEGIVDSVDITEADLRAGLFNDAEMWYFEINYEDIPAGKAKLDYGNLGEVELAGGEFKVKFRSMTQNLDQEIVDKFGRYCRNVLGDENCGVVFSADSWQELTAYDLGDYVVSVPDNGRINKCTTAGTSSAASSSTYDQNVMANLDLLSYWRLGEASAGPGAVDETGLSNGSYFGSPTFSEPGLIVNTNTSVKFNRANASDFVNMGSANGPDNLFHSGPASVVAWFNATGVNGADADSGSIVYKDDASGNVNNQRQGWGIAYHGAPNNNIRFFQRFKSGSTQSYAVYNTLVGSVVQGNTYQVAVVYDASSTSNVPVIFLNGVEQTLSMQNTPTAGHVPDEDGDAPLTFGTCDPFTGSTRYFDGTIDEVSIYTGALTASQIFSDYNLGIGNLLSGPTWDLTIGNTTADGSVVWTTLDSYTITGAVTLVASRSQFTSNDILAYADDYFSRGVITFTSGDNVNISRDVKRSLATGEIDLLYPAPFAIQTGDTFEMSAGCNHIFKDAVGGYTGDCKSKFSNSIERIYLNFNGEPFIPGENQIIGGQ